ncbi:MAG: 16S rRNA (cytosine(1402)-N(4))-methyltransferase RsmH [Thermoanaerobaculia bacterium]
MELAKCRRAICPRAPGRDARLARPGTAARSSTAHSVSVVTPRRSSIASPTRRLFGIDRDRRALDLARARLAPFAARVHLVEGDFAQIAELWEQGPWSTERPAKSTPISGCRLQLGTRTQFQFPAGRTARRHRGQGAEGGTAAELIASATEGELEQIFREYGDEPDARRVARAVVGARELHPIDTTAALADVVRRSKRRGRRDEKIDPATRVFQALRIAVNEELAAIEELLDRATRLLEQDGRLVVISFQSLEDRIVKNRIRELARGEVDQTTGRTRSETRLLDVLTKKPVRPSVAEIDVNPRSRSARLRAARRL